MVGASRRQVLRLACSLEALALGFARVASSGIGAGFGLAKGLNALFAAMGSTCPRPGTVVRRRARSSSSLLVGTLATLLAALVPARRATRIAPVAALRDAAITGGARAPAPPARVRGLASVVGRPAERIGGAAGALARRNAMRNPGRTAVTASALMIGVALVTAVDRRGPGPARLQPRLAGASASRPAHVITGADGWSPTDPKVEQASPATPGVKAVTAIRQDGALAFGRPGGRQRRRPGDDRRSPTSTGAGLDGHARARSARRRGRRRRLRQGARARRRRPLHRHLADGHDAAPDRARRSRTRRRSTCSASARSRSRTAAFDRRLRARAQRAPDVRRRAGAAPHAAAGASPASRTPRCRPRPPSSTSRRPGSATILAIL